MAPDPNTPVLVTSPDTRPTGYRLTATQVLRIALTSTVVRAELRRHPRARSYEYTKGPGRWQVSWFSAGPTQKELLQVYVEDATGRVTEAWTGYQVAWTMARGYNGAFGRRAGALYVWIPLCVLFLVPFLPLRRGRRFCLLHLDLAVLLGFSISLAFFNHARIGVSVPLAYPFLLYLLVRMLLLAFGRGRPRAPLRLLVPVSWLAVAVVFLVGFRIGLNVLDSNVIDVGYAGVIGAHKVLHGEAMYGHWPHDNPSGDTYGPVNYYAYVPAVAAFGWSGSWDQLPAAHAAAVAFDLLTLLGLFLLGRRVRGPTVGIILAYLWAAYPFSLFALACDSNDGLVALLVVAALLVATGEPQSLLRRGGTGVAAALAGLTKLAPLALAPMLARGSTAVRLRGRGTLVYCLAFVGTVAVAMLPVLSGHNWHFFWQDTIAYQAGRSAPFSIWGLWGGLGLEQHVVQGAAAALAIIAAVLPRRRTPVQLAAMGAAILIAVQLGVTYWFYLYIPWFFPLVALALVGSFPTEREAALAAAFAAGPEPVPALAAA